MSYKTGFYEGRLGIGLGSTMGMGDGNPRYSLDINGDIRLTGSIVNGDGQILSLTPPEYTPVTVGLDANNSLIYNFEKQGTHTGSQNILIGKHAGTDLTTANNIICLGIEAGSKLTAAHHHIAIGYYALQNCTDRTNAIMIGQQAGRNFSGGDYCIGIGPLAMYNPAGSHNIAMGYSAMQGTSGTQSHTGNIALGFESLKALTSGGYNVAIGYQIATSITSGIRNCVMGYQTGLGVTNGNQNVYIGDRTGYSASTASTNVGIGYMCLYGSCTADFNIGIGYECMYEGPNGNGTDNTNGGRHNVCMGWRCGKWISTGAKNVYIGYMAGQGTTHSTGYHNVFIGNGAGEDIQGGYDNTCIGGGAGRNITSGAYNLCLGYGAGKNVTTAANNFLVGTNSGQALTTGAYNCFMGWYAGSECTTGEANTIVGHQAGRYCNTACHGCIFLGKLAGPKGSDGNHSNKLAIGAPAGQDSDTYRGDDGAFIWGDFNSTTLTARYLRINGHLGINCNPTSTYGLKVDSGNVLLRNGSTLCWGNNNSSIEGNHSAEGSNNGNLYFRTNQAYRMCIIENGNVGIGTTSPQTMLDVKGQQITNGNCLTLRNGNSGGSYDKSQILLSYWGQPYNGTGHCHKIQTRHQSQTTHHQNAIDFYLWKNGQGAGDIGSTHGMSITAGGVGIGTTSPSYPLYISGGKSGINAGNVGYLHSTGASNANNANNDTISLFTTNTIWANQYVFASSDERIKENIIDVSDNKALTMLRNIPCRYYEYKDKVSRGTGKTIGFIAQEVKEILPMAVSFQTNIIPNEMRELENISWEEIIDGSNNTYKLTTDLSDCSGIKYRFYVGNDPSGNDECKKEIIGNQDNTFTFDTSYNNVFCYGNEVDDFHTLDKQKLFALNFSATQELDKKVIALENENAELKAELAEIKQHLGI